MTTPFPVKVSAAAILMLATLAVISRETFAGQHSESAPHRCAGCATGACRPNARTFGWWPTGWRRWPTATPYRGVGGRKGAAGIPEVQVPGTDEEARFEERTRSEKPLDADEIISVDLPSGDGSQPAAESSSADTQILPDAFSEGADPSSAAPPPSIEAERNPFAPVDENALPTNEQDDNPFGAGGNIFDSMEDDTSPMSTPDSQPQSDGFEPIDFGFSPVDVGPNSDAESSNPNDTAAGRSKIEPPRSLQLRQVSTAVPVPTLGGAELFSDADLLPPSEMAVPIQDAMTESSETRKQSSFAPSRDQASFSRAAEAPALLNQTASAELPRKVEPLATAKVEPVSFEWNPSDWVQVDQDESDQSSHPQLYNLLAGRFAAENPLRHRLRRRGLPAPELSARPMTKSQVAPASSEALAAMPERRSPPPRSLRQTLRNPLRSR